MRDARFLGIHASKVFHTTSKESYDSDARRKINRLPTDLPELFPTGLSVVFVNINPAVYSLEQGHYFARRSNKFWPCISRSTLTTPMREELNVETLGPDHDQLLPLFGIGFTDLVSRATPRAADVAPSEFIDGVAILEQKILERQPHVACFHGVTGYQYAYRIWERGDAPIRLGLQRPLVGKTRIFVVPNPSGANAHYTRAEQTGWYDRLAMVAQGNK
jgi:TDG/mug DNA glycosylase family protein